jgi:hypothetical protein
MLALLLLLQAGDWVVSPLHPTVGDTVWLAREVTMPAAWRLRAGKLEGAEPIEPLGDPVVVRTANGWVIRYAVVVWAPGAREVTLPPAWRLAPDGRTDSLPGGVATFAVRSVIPDSVQHPEPQAAIAPLRPERRRPEAPIAAIAVAAGAARGGDRVASPAAPRRPAGPSRSTGT